MNVFLCLFPMSYYYSNQSIAKFSIKTGVVIFKLVKRLNLIIMAYLCC